MAGKRHSKADMVHIQGTHDNSVHLGADCSMANVAWPTFEAACQEAALPMIASHDSLRNQLRTSLMLAHQIVDTYNSRGPYILDVFPGEVVYQFGGVSYRRTYKVNLAATPPTATLGAASVVNLAYIDAGTGAKESQGYLQPVLEGGKSVIITPDNLIEESTILSEDFVFECVEAAGVKSSTIPVKLISPGWGTTGYYSTEMLKRDGPKVFTEGLHMYMDHPTRTEEKELPERSHKALAAVLTENAAWQDKGFDGPGIYSAFKTFSDHDTAIREKGKFTGVSIRAYATNISEGEAEGRKGKIIEGFSRALSTDFVTRPGRGGKALVTESERPPEPQITQESSTMTPQEEIQLREAQTAKTTAEAALALAVAEGTRLKAEKNQAIATAAIIEVFKSKGLEISMESAKLLAANPPLTEKGDVDLEAIKKIGEGLKAVKKTASGVRDLGDGSPVDESAASVKADLAEIEGMLKGSSFGLSEAAAKIAAHGRV